MRRPKYALDPVRANQGAVPAKDDVPPFNKMCQEFYRYQKKEEKST